MIKAILNFLLVCAPILVRAQTNYVKNPGFESYTECPDGWNKIYYVNHWRNASDSTLKLGIEYYNVCGNSFLNKNAHVPENNTFWQHPHKGFGMAGAVFYNDKTLWAEKGDLPFNYRDNLQGHLITKLTAGKTYCVTFWLNVTEGSGYVNNKIGVYLDNGSINAIADTPGEEITSVTPQIYTNDIIEDTMAWTKIEGSFVATGTESYLTIGNFFPNSMVDTKYPNYWNAFVTISYYLVDDVSVVPIDWTPQAGPDTWVELGKKVSIGDSTADGMDSKWYHKGILIDSGGMIKVNAATTVGKIDTYVVKQTVCGITKTDTVVVRTVPLGVTDHEVVTAFRIYPNPSGGTFTISPVIPNGAQRREETLHIKVYDLPGRVVYEDRVKDAFRLDAAEGFYVAEIRDSEGRVHRERLAIRH